MPYPGNKKGGNRKVFGQATKYQRQFGNGGGKPSSYSKGKVDDDTAAQRRRAARGQAKQVQDRLGVRDLPLL